MAAFIIGSGVHLPERTVSNEELADSLGLEPDYIFKFSGIRRRHWATEGSTTSSLASHALRAALQDAHLVPKDIDYLLFGTMTADRFIPGSASAIQSNVGLGEVPCLDIRATCCNALYGLQLALALIGSGIVRNVAICLAELQSKWLELSPEAGKLSMLFGDGASTLIVSAESSSSSLQILDVLLATDGGYIDELGIRCPGTEFGSNPNDEDLNVLDWRPRMVGQTVILQASRRMTEICQSILDRNNITIDDIRWLVPHQANRNLIERLTRNLHFSQEDGAVVSVLEESGNTSSASMGIALDKLRRSNAIQIGDLLLLPAFGSGFTWGAALCKAC